MLEFGIYVAGIATIGWIFLYFYEKKIREIHNQKYCNLKKEKK